MEGRKAKLEEEARAAKGRFAELETLVHLLLSHTHTPHTLHTHSLSHTHTHRHIHTHSLTHSLSLSQSLSLSAKLEEEARAAKGRSAELETLVRLSLSLTHILALKSRS